MAPKLKEDYVKLEEKTLENVHSTKQSKLDNIKAWGKKEVWTGFGTEMKGTLRLASGLFVPEVSQFFMMPLATAFAGHLGTIELDAVTMGNTIINVFGNFIAVTASLACDTYFSQTYGSPNRKLVGVQLQKSAMIFALLYMVCISIQLNMKHFLHFINIHDEVARLTFEYIETFAPGLLLLFIYTLLRKYVQVHNVIAVHIITSAVGVTVQCVSQYLLLYYFDYGVKGSAIGLCLAFGSMVIVMIAYIFISGIHKETWTGLSRQSLFDWGPIFRLAVSCMLMVCAEWWAFNVATFVAGARSLIELGAISVLFYVEWAFYGAANGVAVASAIRVGQYLGAGNVIKARTTLIGGALGVGIASLFGTVIITLCARQLGTIFTNDTEILDLVEELTPLFSAYVFLTLCATASRCMLNVIGKAMFGSITTFVCFYLLALPIGLHLWLNTPLGLYGMWIGFLIAVGGIHVMIDTYIIVWADWDSLAEEAEARAEVKHIPKYVIGTEEPLTTKEQDQNTLLNTVNDVLTMDSLVPGGGAAYLDAANWELNQEDVQSNNNMNNKNDETATIIDAKPQKDDLKQLNARNMAAHQEAFAANHNAESKSHDETQRLISDKKNPEMTACVIFKRLMALISCSIIMVVSIVCSIAIPYQHRQNVAVIANGSDFEEMWHATHIEEVWNGTMSGVI